MVLLRRRECGDQSINSEVQVISRNVDRWGESQDVGANRVEHHTGRKTGCSNRTGGQVEFGPEEEASPPHRAHTWGADEAGPEVLSGVPGCRWSVSYTHLTLPTKRIV